MVDYSYKIIQEWAAGRRLTDPLDLYGIDEIVPTRYKYKKPILVLINELDFSAGDFFPATLQDNGRAKLLGTRTAGAGGYVLRFGFPNLSAIKTFSLTASLAERSDKDPIENLGVTPDVKYEISPEDLEFNYGPYKMKIIENLEEMLKGK
jgi:C-terminal processing protease CtpA/Prc